MLLDYRRSPPVGEGNYACVFPVGDRVAKLFRRYPQFPPRQTESGRKLVFEAQVLAYQTASEDPFLRLHIPEFYGAATVTDVIDPNGLSIAADFFLGHCYVVERLHGPEVGFPEASRANSNASIGLAKQRFDALSISVHDASVFYADDPENFKVIDFEIANYVYERLDMRSEK